MVSTSAQKRATKNYIDKLKSKGINQHCLYCTDLQWAILRELIKVVKQMNLDGISSMDVDDDGRYIKFIYDNPPETRVVPSNQDEDDKG